MLILQQDSGAGEKTDRRTERTYICDECIGICSEIIEEELDYNDDRAFDDINLLTPEEMKAFLDDYVIGQDEAKKVLSDGSVQSL